MCNVRLPLVPDLGTGSRFAASDTGSPAVEPSGEGKTEPASVGATLWGGLPAGPGAPRPRPQRGSPRPTCFQPPKPPGSCGTENFLEARVS